MPRPRTNEDDLLLERIRQLRLLPPPDPMQDVPHPGQPSQSYNYQADQLERRAEPPAEPGDWRGIGEAALRGLAGSTHPGGYHGYRADLDARERQRQQDLLARAQRLRAEGLQRDQMNLEGQREQRLTESSNAQLEETKRLRAVQEARENREANQPQMVSPGAGVLFPGERQPSYTQPFNERTEPQPTANIQEYNFYAEQERGANRQPLSFDQWQQREATRRPSTSLNPFPVVIQTPSGPQLLDRRTGEANPITSGGERVGLAPTADMRNRDAAMTRVDPVLNSISELSERINTGAGVIAKASGEAEKAKARLNYNDDVAEYESLISGFTPLVARAVGHSGVLTEQDVQSVRALFPKPGDSKTLRDRKIARVKTILDAVRTPADTSPTNTTSPTSNTGQTVPMVTPDGKVWNVPANKVKEAEARGAKRQ